MAYIIHSLQKINLRKKIYKRAIKEEDKLFIEVVIITLLIMIVDIACVVKFIEILEKL